jgi:hypothetical protein
MLCESAAALDGALRPLPWGERRSEHSEDTTDFANSARSGARVGGSLLWSTRGAAAAFPPQAGSAASAARLDCGEVGSSVRPKRTRLPTVGSARAGAGGIT